MHKIINPWRYSGPEHVSDKYGHTELSNDPYSAYLVKQFLDWLTRGACIKETDAFFLEWLLASISDSRPNIIITHRDPRDCIASFKKNELYSRWGYKEKMRWFTKIIHSAPLLNSLYGRKFSREGFSELPWYEQLAIYYAITIQEIERITKPFHPLHVYHKEMVDNPIRYFKKILNFLKIPWNKKIEQAIIEMTMQTRGTDPYATYRKKEDVSSFTVILSNKEEVTIRSRLKDIGILLSEPETILSSIAKPNTKKMGVKKTYIKIPLFYREAEIKTIQSNTIEINNIICPHLFVQKTVTTNLEYARFLCWLVNNEIPLTINGKSLFFSEQQQFIRFLDGKIYIEKEHKNHPATFINWVGAAIYSTWVGGRLPSVEEWQYAIVGESFDNIDVLLQSANVEQKYSGTTSVKKFPPDKRGVYDRIGNVSIWTTNHENTDLCEKTKAGLEWNHSRSRGLIVKRPFWLGTSGLGVRPVFTHLNRYVQDSKFAEKIKELVLNLTKPKIRDNKQVSLELFSLINDFFHYNDT